MSPPSPPPARIARPAALLLAAGLVLSGAAAVPAAPAAARAPPWPVCGLCDGETLAAAADARGVDVEAGHATLDVHALANGSTRWTARVDLTDGVEAMRDDSLRRAVVERAIRTDHRALSTRLADGTLVVTYRRDDAAVRGVGAVGFTPLHASDPLLPFAMGGEGTAYPGADELVVHAPDGYVFEGGAGDGNASRTAVRWAGPEGGEAGIDRDTVPTFVREGAPFPGVRGWLVRLLAG